MISPFSDVKAPNKFWDDIPLPEPEKKEGGKGSPSPKCELRDTLEAVKSFLCRYIVFQSESQAIAIALWIVHTWVIDAFDYTPYLHISSPAKRCGKSRLFDCLGLLCAKPWSIIGATEASLFRKIQKDAPTILLDEVDAVFTAKKADDGKEAIRALLNAGFERGAVVPRCTGQQFTVTEFPVFCPKAFAGIGSLPDTISDRSVTIKMERRARGQTIEKLRMRDAKLLAEPIKKALEAWSQELSVIPALHPARPEIPNELGDRAADICEPLLAIADMAGERWQLMARSALVELCCEGASEESIGVQLLGAIREIFTQTGKDKISTEDLLRALVARENGEPWANFWEKDLKAGNTRGPGTKVAGYLKTFGIVSGTIREEDGSTPKGYKLESFADAFSRYLPL
jgi:hypothetical protein